MSFDYRITNKKIYYLLRWSESKFYAVCKQHVEFVAYLETKRELARIDTLEDMQDVVVTAAKNGNVVAAFFALKALGVSDGSHPVQELEKDTEKDPNHLAPEDFTLTELKQIKKCKDAAKKRKAKKVKK